jgi:hypothetical protein
VFCGRAHRIASFAYAVAEVYNLSVLALLVSTKIAEVVEIERPHPSNSVRNRRSCGEEGLWYIPDGLFSISIEQYHVGVSRKYCSQLTVTVRACIALIHAEKLRSE